MSRRSPLGQVLGLGSAKEGAEHWWAQRVTAVALIPLGLWFVFSMAVLIGGGNSDLFAKAAGTDYYAETSVGEFLLGSRPQDAYGVKCC